jgi:ABC-type branched-subunit amino acid transport system substrate-binding protein
MRKLTTRKWVKVAVPFVTLALVAAACGDDDDDAADSTTAEGTTADTEPADTEPADTEPADTEPADTEPADTEPAGTEPSVPTEIATDFGVTDDTITIGLNADLSGIFAPLVTQIVDGQEAYWEIVNDNGGIAGRQVELVVLDNGYDVPKHLENYETMSAESDDGVLMFSQSTGSPHTAATASALVEDNLLAIPLSWYSGWADPAIGENVIELYTSYCLESMNGLTFLAGAQEASTVAIISFPGEYGQDGAFGAKAAAEALGLEVVYDGEGAVVPGADQTPVITELVNAQPDLVWATINPTTLAEIMGGAYAQGLRAHWSGNSPTYNFQLLATDLAPALDELYTHSTYTQLWNSADVPGMTEMVEGMRSKRPEAPVSDVYIVAWTEGYATQQILEQAAANGDMTRAGVVAAAKDPNLEIDFKGLSPNQTFSGDPNDYIVRESYMYDVDSSKFTAGGTVSDEDAGTGFTLLDGPFVSDTAANYDFQGACFVPSG